MASPVPLNCHLPNSRNPTIQRKWITLSDFHSLGQAPARLTRSASRTQPPGSPPQTGQHRHEALDRPPPPPNIIEALRDFKVLSKVIATRPTHVRELVPELPSYIDYSDACNTEKMGALKKKKEPQKKTKFKSKSSKSHLGHKTSRAGTERLGTGAG
jgi:hypothetical protein